MQIRKTLIGALAATVAIAFSPLPELSAAPFAGNGSQAVGSDLIHSVQAKKAEAKAGKKKRKGKKAGKAKGGKSCGTFKYRKGGKCLDARNKK